MNPVVVLLVTGLAAAIRSTNAAVLPLVHVQATTHRDLGFKIGSLRNESIREFLHNPKGSLVKVFKPFYDTEDGRQFVDGMVETSRRAFPRYVEELDGMAQALQVDPIELYLYNMDSEINLRIAEKQAAANEPPRDTHCTDLFSISNEHQRWIAHNEDYSEEMIDHCFLVNASIVESGEAFLAFMYPASLAGWAFAFNSQGLVTTANAVFPKHVRSKDTVPVTFAARLALSAESPDQVLTLLNSLPADVGIGGGLALNLGSTRTQTFTSLELASSGNSVFQIKGYPSFFAHVNQYEHSQMKASETLDESSVSRRRRLRDIVQMDPTLPYSSHGLLSILSDQHDEDYPIYRSGNADSVYTLASALFDFYSRRLLVWAYLNPSGNMGKPTYVLEIPLGNDSLSQAS